MPKIGVSGPWLGRYNNINGVVSYTQGTKLARIAEFEAEPDDADDDNNYYSDNSLSETARGESRSGTITTSIDHFSQEGSKLILGTQEKTIQIDGETVTYLVYNDDAKPGYFGFGVVIKKRKNGQDLWRAVVYRKVMFNVPGDAANTQGESIEWQSEELEAVYMPDDSAKHEWKNDATFDSESRAVAFVSAILNIGEIGTLTVTSAAGSAVGTTAIAVTPALISGNSYMYTVAPEVGLPTYNQLIGEGYLAWDGTAEIAARTGHEILIVEVDAERRAQKGGIATVMSNDG